MKVSIDLDGCLWQHMGFFRPMWICLVMQGHEVGILTLHSERIKEADLQLLTARGFPAPNFFLAVPEGMPAEPNGGMGFKARMIREHGIDWHFDDFDFGDAGSEEIMYSLPEGARVFQVRHREPHNEHFE